MAVTMEQVRTKLEDAVWQALEAGMSADVVRDEVNYAIESVEEDS